MGNNKKKNKKKELPFVSVCTPTFNRRPFIPFTIKCFNNQDYPKDRREDRVQEALSLVGLAGGNVEDRYPSELSGGQQQRVAFARAISYEPKLLLMDEPLSNLDFQLRKRMRQSILDILDEIKVTTVYVTHDQEEAFEISDDFCVTKRICLLFSLIEFSRAAIDFGLPTNNGTTMFG